MKRLQHQTCSWHWFGIFLACAATSLRSAWPDDHPQRPEADQRLSVEPLPMFLSTPPLRSDPADTNSNSSAETVEQDWNSQLATEKERQFDRIRQKLLYLMIDRRTRSAPPATPEFSTPPQHEPTPTVEITPKINSPVAPPSQIEDTPVPLMEHPQSPLPPQSTLPQPSAVIPAIPLSEPKSFTAFTDHGLLPPALDGAQTDSLDSPSEQPPDGPALVSETPQEPVDRLGLADSFFATGELTLALQSYQDIPLETLPAEDALWVNYQIGCCFRRQGQTDLAIQRYQAVVEQDDAGWLGKLSRWWIETINARQAVIDTEQKLVQALKHLESAHEQTTPDP